MSYESGKFHFGEILLHRSINLQYNEGYLTFDCLHILTKNPHHQNKMTKDCSDFGLGTVHCKVFVQVKMTRIFILKLTLFESPYIFF